MQKAVLIANADARHGEEIQEARKLLEARGVRIEVAHLVKGGKELCRCVDREISRGQKLIIVGGGDGSLTSVVGAFAHQKSVLGVLPLGTGNSFAQSLGIGTSIENAVDAIAHGKCARVDLGRVNGRYFANFATIGLSSEIAAATPNALKRIVGPVAYALSGVVPLLLHKPFHAVVRWPNKKLKMRTHQLIVANGRYYGNTPLLPDATLTDGKLAFFGTSGTTTWDIAFSFIALTFGKQTELGDAHAFSAKKFKIETKPRVRLSIDGEAIGKTPATFSVDRRALRVMVPN